MERVILKSLPDDLVRVLNLPKSIDKFILIQKYLNAEFTELIFQKDDNNKEYIFINKSKIYNFNNNIVKKELSKKF